MSTYTPIASVTLSSAQSSVTFSGIPQTYTDLVLVVNCAISSGTGNSKLQFNSDTATNYSQTSVEGTGSSAVSSRYSTQSQIYLEGSGYLNTTFQNTKIINIQNYTNTTTNKTVLLRNGGAGAGVDAIVGLWRSTSAITSFTITTTASTFVSGSTFNLYGVANASITNVAKATGGDSVTTDGTYWYHTFRSSGTFTPTQALTCDYLVVAGGGGAAGMTENGGGTGGAGAGGFRSFTSQSLTAQGYTVTVGAGGAGGGPGYITGTKGSNSVFSTNTATGGANSPATNTGVTGGSGSGGRNGGNGGAGNQGGYSPSEGNNGGNSTSDGGGGGGGAGAAGANTTTNAGGNGGNGTASSISGTSVTYAGGGGGGGYNNAAGGTGGTGGGGAGRGNNTTGGNGTANTGGGGGGTGGLASGGVAVAGGAGGSGIVIVRYSV